MNAKFRDANDFIFQSQVKQQFSLRRYKGNYPLGNTGQFNNITSLICINRHVDVCCKNNDQEKEGEKNDWRTITAPPANDN